ncbi:hypothetical protein [Sulfurimonas sp. HSL-1716]|uniref:hypothetical protein n=1 Tax=Hydrocurvibacter sulfurireducens TaxID=3131937 RepID=UPI0031F991D8
MEYGETDIMNRTPEQQKALFEKFDDDMKKKSRWYRYLLVKDQTFNVVWLNGSQDETISSHIGRLQQQGKSNRFLDLVCCFLQRFEYNHCKKSEGE